MGNDGEELRGYQIKELKGAMETLSGDVVKAVTALTETNKNLALTNSKLDEHINDAAKRQKVLEDHQVIIYGDKDTPGVLTRLKVIEDFTASIKKMQWFVWSIIAGICIYGMYEAVIYVGSIMP